MAPAGQPLSGAAHPHHRPDAADPSGIRLVPHRGAARRGGQPDARRRRAAGPGPDHRVRLGPTSRTSCCSSATRCTPTRPPRRCRSSSASGANLTSRRVRRSRTTRSTPTSTGSRGRDPRTGWLLSTVPSCMIFDDHDIRDDWNTSLDVARGDERRLGGTSGSSAGSRPTGSTSTSGTCHRPSCAPTRSMPG